MTIMLPFPIRIHLYSVCIKIFNTGSLDFDIRSFKKKQMYS